MPLPRATIVCSYNIYRANTIYISRFFVYTCARTCGRAGYFRRCVNKCPARARSHTLEHNSFERVRATICLSARETKNSPLTQATRLTVHLCEARRGIEEANVFARVYFKHAALMVREFARRERNNRSRKEVDQFHRDAINAFNYP